MAKFCTECGHALTEETTVCPECGTRVQNSASPSPEKKAEAQRAIPTENRQAAEVCPKCGSTDIDKLQRITGYLVGTTDRWNSAKLAELRDRIVHK